MARATHAARLERWLGTAAVDRLSRGMAQWYGPPIAVSGVPGNVWAHRGGDFSGPIHAGHASTLTDYVFDRGVRAIKRWNRAQWSQANMAGFASLSDLIAEFTGGKGQPLAFQKTGSAQTQFVGASLWRNGTLPSAGAAGSAAPGGRIPTSATTGALTYINPTAGDTLHFISAWVTHSAGGQVLLYDRLFDVAKTMSSLVTEAVTGVPTRYTSSTTTAQDYAAGNFLFIETFAALGATAHNWTVCKYTNQAGTAGQTAPSLTGTASAIIDTLDMPLTYWFMPLAAGDTGVQALTQMQCSASVTGSINFVVGHPIAWITCPVALTGSAINGIRDAFQLVRVFDSACLAFLNVTALTTSAPAINGTLNFCAG